MDMEGSQSLAEYLHGLYQVLDPRKTGASMYERLAETQGKA